VADAVTELLDELPRVGVISFRLLTAGLVERLAVVVRFLAVLELFRQGFVDLDQPRAFGDIEIVWLGRDRSELDELTPVDAYDG
jgi:segregation and condensation protein A